MEHNPYAAPQASAGSTNGDERLSPPLWNPGAAAAWSLLFGPMFGAFVHMKNWQALRRPDKAASSRRWFIANLLLLIVSLALAFLVPPSGAIGAFNFFGGIGFLLAWYFFSAREQMRFIAMAYDKHYQRRGWGTPLLYAVLAITGLGIVAGMANSLIAAARLG
jgi:hypothetical protein